MVNIIRFFRGYIMLAISGSRPETFLNVMTSNGIAVWGVKSSEGVIYCKTLAVNYRYIYNLSRRKSIKIRIIKKTGMPFFVNKNKKHMGIPIGAVCFALIFAFLSRYLWYVDIYGYEAMSKSRADTVMKEIGVYEGAKGKFDSLRNLQTKALIAFGDVSWITINTDAAAAEVKITETTVKTAEPDDKHYNITAKCDGQIIRADVQKGMSYVNGGDAVVKGSLLIGGFVQTDLGSTILDTAQGVVMAKTSHREKITIPKKTQYRRYEDSFVTRQNAKVFGIYLPLEMRCTDANREKMRYISEYALSFKGKTAPVYAVREHIYYLDNEQTELSEKSSEKLFTAQRLLCELFSYSDKKITDRNITKSADDDNFYYEIEYSCDEDIGQREEIMFDEDFSYNSEIMNIEE